MTALAIPTTKEGAGFVSGFLKIAEAANRLDVHPRTLARWIHLGRFPGTIKNDPDAKTGSYFRIPIEAIEAFEKRRVVTTPGKE